MRWLVVKLPFALYRAVLSPAIHLFFGPGYGCRFEPTCSQYAQQAVDLYGPVHGGELALARICRCHPFSSGGFDPVPRYGIASTRKVSANGS